MPKKKLTLNLNVIYAIKSLFKNMNPNKNRKTSDFMFISCKSRHINHGKGAVVELWLLKPNKLKGLLKFPHFG